MRNVCRISLLSSLRVQQTPAEMHRLPSSSANLSCSHSIQNYDKILWYRQQGDGMQLLGYMNMMHGYPEPGVNVNITGSARQGQTCTLTIQDLSLSSSAVYFCAASYHSATSN
uniref:Ig-like domain-containing protein n=1 Tax=Oryzias latipes TaxID=8090 RepID=A0A3B3H5Y3_ORYLA